MRDLGEDGHQVKLGRRFGAFTCGLRLTGISPDPASTEAAWLVVSCWSDIVSKNNTEQLRPRKTSSLLRVCFVILEIYTKVQTAVRQNILLTMRMLDVVPVTTRVACHCRWSEYCGSKQRFWLLRKECSDKISQVSERLLMMMTPPL